MTLVMRGRVQMQNPVTCDQCSQLHADDHDSSITKCGQRLRIPCALSHRQCKVCYPPVGAWEKAMHIHMQMRLL